MEGVLLGAGIGELDGDSFFAVFVLEATWRPKGERFDLSASLRFNFADGVRNQLADELVVRLFRSGEFAERLIHGFVLSTKKPAPAVRGVALEQQETGSWRIPSGLYATLSRRRRSPIVIAIFYKTVKTLSRAFLQFCRKFLYIWKKRPNAL